MPEEPEKNPHLSNFEVDERAVEAQALLSNPVAMAALREVYSRALGTLLNADVGSLTATTAHASMKAIHDIKGQLEQYVDDQKMRRRFGKK